MQESEVQQVPDAFVLPIAQASPTGHPRSAAQFPWQHLPRNAAAQHEEDAGETDAIRDARPSTVRHSWHSWHPRHPRHPRHPTYRLARAEDFVEFVRLGDLELIVAAVRRRFVGPPAQEHCAVTEAIALKMIVLDLADAVDA